MSAVNPSDCQCLASGSSSRSADRYERSLSVKMFAAGLSAAASAFLITVLAALPLLSPSLKSSGLTFPIVRLVPKQAYMPPCRSAIKEGQVYTKERDDDA